MSSRKAATAKTAVRRSDGAAPGREAGAIRRRALARR